jgi:hypothetical protein
MGYQPSQPFEYPSFVMKLAIMQPYLFPYLGYFQLIAAVDKFVIYDDVAFIKQGWVNRNHILLQGKPHLFTVPLQGASSNKTIRDTLVSVHEYPRWKDKFLKTIALAYAKAPHYEVTRALLSRVIEADPGSIGELARRAIREVCHTLGLTTQIEPSSTVYENGHLHAQERVLDICVRERATLYINAPGGRDLYASEAFAARGIELRFLGSRLAAYPQFKHEFVPALSIIDGLMFNSPQQVNMLLKQCDFVSKGLS